ncbi:MAG TPA: UDP-N-acetylmuramoyl-L-alanine--D-glutamate ligase [Bacillota bacterium]
MKKLLDFSYQHILVFGLAKSGTAAAKALLKHGRNVRVNDRDAKENDPNVQELIRMGAEVIVGSHPLSVLDHIELVVKNPGIPYDHPLIKEAEKRELPIITEIELAYHLSACPMIGITGSNGKTTTTMLITEMLATSNQRVKIAGNIGTVATDVALTTTRDEQMVVELSSFQLLGIRDFRPKIAVLLNIYEAHLDYHQTFLNYQQAKSNLFKNQTSDDYLIYNADQLLVSSIVEKAISKKIPFSIRQREIDGTWVTEDAIYFKDEKIINRQDIALVGNHNLENIVAAITVAKLSGATNEAIRKVLQTFSGVKHRLQFVDTINNRLFYNDSKATNVLATEKALASFKQPTILLAGGLDRGNSFANLIPFLNHVKAMVVFGETAKKLEETAIQAGIATVEYAKDVEDAVYIAYNLSKEDDVILLSPACASWDQYNTFEERGNMFIQAVHTLK